MNNLRKLRLEHQLTIRELADILVCDFSLYSKYERDERSIPIKYLVILSDFYDTNSDFLLGRTDYPKKLPSSKEPSEYDPT